MNTKERAKAALEQLESQGVILVSTFSNAELKEVLSHYIHHNDDKLVVLPVKVAEALENARALGFSNSEIVCRSFDVADLGQYRNAVRDFAADNFDNFVSALVNGYTVETLESKIEAALLKFVEKAKRADLIVAHDTEEFSKAITEVVTRVLREEQA